MLLIDPYLMVFFGFVKLLRSIWTDLDLLDDLLNLGVAVASSNFPPS